MPIHLSVQANTGQCRRRCASGARPASAGDPVPRAVARRDPSIRQDCPDTELEGLHPRRPVHRLFRALPPCRATSNHRDPNQGTCTNAAAGTSKTTAHARPAAQRRRACWKSPRSALANTHAPSRKTSTALPCILNSRDLRAMRRAAVTEIGIDSFKIEGRTKNLLRGPDRARPTARPSTTPLRDGASDPGASRPARRSRQPRPPTASTVVTPPRTQNYLRGHRMGF